MKRTFLLIFGLLFLFSKPAVCSGADYRYPGNNKVLLYAPGYFTEGQYQIADAAGTDFSSQRTQNSLTRSPWTSARTSKPQWIWSNPSAITALLFADARAPRVAQHSVRAGG